MPLLSIKTMKRLSKDGMALDKHVQYNFKTWPITLPKS